MRPIALSLVVLLALVGCDREEPRFHPRGASAHHGSSATEEPATTGDGPQAAPRDVAAPPADAVRTASGLASRVLAAGTGTTHPGPTDRVTVHYTGWTTDGQQFDSSRGGEPASFPLDHVIAGWTEGVQLMVAGERRRFWIPQDLAYRGQPGPPAGMLVFDIELISFVSSPPPAAPAPAAAAIPAPEDVAAVPATAHREASGLASRVLIAGTGTRHPASTSVVEVHYTGWTTDGHMFDSSVQRGTPAQFPLDHVIAGWTEGVQLMVEGETRRFWIPQELAYQGRPGPPAGMLVFDVQLIRIVN
jgi:FKBP-type peptidyl-prolyl cis-trans isomerase